MDTVGMGFTWPPSTKVPTSYKIPNYCGMKPLLCKNLKQQFKEFLPQCVDNSDRKYMVGSERKRERAGLVL